MAKNVFPLPGSGSILLITLTILFYAIWLPLRADTVEEYTAKALLTLNLARYTEWPKEAFDDHKRQVNLCLLGDDFILQAFTKIANKPVGDKMLTVRKINSFGELENCQLVYISSTAGAFAQFAEASSRHHVLTIGEVDDFLELGGMVYLEVSESKINLHINPSATQKAGVQISARVLKLAIIYNP